MNHPVNHRKVLIIGGHGQVALLTIPRLIESGHEVTGLIRQREHQADLEALGATALIKDATELTVTEWGQLMARFDVVVWAAGNGGRAGPEVTTAVDRDAAAASVAAAAGLGENAPRYLMVSFAGSLDIELEPEAALYVYAEAKKYVDRKLLATTGLEYLILAPCVLTTDPADGIEVIPNDPRSAFQDTTSRDLVAAVITEMVGRDAFPNDKILAFRDGGEPVHEL
ncbi:NAD(P)H-binding protein [Corynebacterium halotolerans]|uniref:NAD(P)H-binding protein n=1 Tax=Corynebacterium halotolerans TaxID=225326 RepID=UPI003CF25769